MPHGIKIATCISRVAILLYDTRIRMTIFNLWTLFSVWLSVGFAIYFFFPLYDLERHEFWIIAGLIGSDLSPVVEESLCVSSSSFLSSHSGGTRVAWVHQEASPCPDTKCALCQCDKEGHGRYIGFWVTYVMTHCRQRSLKRRLHVRNIALWISHRWDLCWCLSLWKLTQIRKWYLRKYLTLSLIFSGWCFLLRCMSCAVKVY